MSDTDPKYDAAEATATIVSAYVAFNNLSVSELPALIKSVRGALDNLSGAVAPPPEARVPAVPVRRLVTADKVFCAECGMGFRSLKRHLSAEHSLTPHEYRARWGLKPDSPMVSPNYAAKRSELARAYGLGRKPEPAPKSARTKPKAIPELAAKSTVNKSRSNRKPTSAASPAADEGAGRPAPRFEKA